MAFSVYSRRRGDKSFRVSQYIPLKALHASDDKLKMPVFASNTSPDLKTQIKLDQISFSVHETGTMWQIGVVTWKLRKR